MTGKIKVLITAHEFSPYMGSECSVGWNLVTRLSQFHEITLIHAETNQFGTVNYAKLIDEYFQKTGTTPGFRRYSVKQPFLTRVLACVNKVLSPQKTSIGFPVLYYMGVKVWERKIFRFARALHLDNKFDLVHHLNHISFREPGYLFDLDTPFVWGPVSGLAQIPDSFVKALPFRERVTCILRNAANKIQYGLSFRIRRAARKASLIYCVTKEDYMALGRLSGRTRQLLDAGTYEQGENYRRRKVPELFVTALWAGRLCHQKALNLLIEAVSRSSTLRGKLNLLVAGDGPEKEYYKLLATSHQLNNIRWLGLLSKDELHSVMLDADIFIHTSIKEAASAVVLEALSAGLPVICHDAFGMSYSVTNECGIKIPYVAPEKSISELVIALEQLVDNPAMIAELQAGALCRAKYLTWERMTGIISADYLRIVNTKMPFNI